MNKKDLLDILEDLGYEGVADAVAEQVSETYARASNDVIGVMCDRLRGNGELIPSDAIKIANMARNRDLAEIKSILAKATDDGIAAVDALLEVLAEDNDELADAIFKAKRIKSTSYINNRELRAILEVSAKRMKKNMLNISKTTAIVVNNRAIRIDKAYIKIVNQSIFAVQQGMTDYNTAIRQTVMRMAVNGVRSLTYESGHKRRLDSAARMNILDGVRAFNQEYRLQQGEQFGADGVEISAHFNCAPDHIDVQGKQYSLKEFEELQASLERPIGELNCQHTISPIVLGISKPAYSKEELKQAKEHSEMELEYTDSRGVKHTTTGYGATQVQRRYELKIRQLKDQKSALERVGDSVGAKEVGKKLTQANKNYKRVSDELGLRTKVNRTRTLG